MDIIIIDKLHNKEYTLGFLIELVECRHLNINHAMTHPLLRRIFVVSAWTLILLSAWQMVRLILHPEHLRSIPEVFHVRVVMGPLVLGGMELFFWFRFFAEERDGARVFAAMMGFFMMMILLVTLLSDPPADSIGSKYFWVYAFVGTTHLAYAMAGKEQGW